MSLCRMASSYWWRNCRIWKRKICKRACNTRLAKSATPVLAPWLTERFGIESRHVRDLGLLASPDSSIFAAAREAGANVFTKERAFVDLVHRKGVPPRLIWTTCGNTSNAECSGSWKELSQKLLNFWNQARSWLKLRADQP